MTRSRKLVGILAGVVLAVQTGVAAAPQNTKYDSVDSYNP